jgi:putative ABC transport system ATP-binding protein
VAIAELRQVATGDLVTVRDVFKIYREGSTETVALRGVSFDLPLGRSTSLMGASGSGKSTLISLIAGLALPSAGQIIFEGADITRLDESARGRLRATQVGLVFQRGNLIPFLSALENVELAMQVAGRRKPGTEAGALLSELGLGQRLRHLPRQLSGGEAQRVAIAVALANQPRLLLADELTGELDSATAAQVLDLLREVASQRGLTVLTVTHNPDVAALADRRLRIEDGRLQDEA